MDDDNYGVDGMDLTSQGAGTYWWDKLLFKWSPFIQKDTDLMICLEEKE